MKLSVYVEGPWIALAEDDEMDDDVIEVSEEDGKRWLAARDAWEATMMEIINKMKEGK
ncbi:hypothetical protein SEA_TEUTSCH_195 [Streptomyces phage Teutsch]|uniref:Uncharacterized protein n=1 Tax=Streptomyces phage Teutsch TaxID=2510588 RepID=A0A411B6C6_9CAUD|nr:hypothetical protein SEA_TEUTSCH_195 [Streptomyces phage Teutsch]